MKTLSGKKERFDAVQWEREQEDYLLELTVGNKNKDWKSIANLINDKFITMSVTPKDCFRYWKILTGGRESWSDKERYLLLVAHQKYKNRWAEVAQALHKQSRNFVKNRFYTLFRKVRNRIKNGNVHVNSLLDLLEILYMLSIVEQYNKPFMKKSTHEKNYAYKLVQKIDKEKVTKYKTMLKEAYNKSANMEKLFEKFSILYDPKTQQHPERLKIPINEIEAGIILPQPKSFHACEMMSAEEKDSFWKSAFCHKEAKFPAEFSNLTGDSTKISMLIQPDITRCIMKNNEGFEFAQFSSLVESEKHNKHFLLPSLSEGILCVHGSESSKSTSAHTKAEMLSPRFQHLPSLQAVGIVREKAKEISGNATLEITHIDKSHTWGVF